jgi:hypothetical protein
MVPSSFLGSWKCLKNMAPQVGLESTRKRKTNSLQVSGWHPRPRKAGKFGLTERG